MWSKRRRKMMRDSRHVAHSSNEEAPRPPAPSQAAPHPEPASSDDVEEGELAASDVNGQESTSALRDQIAQLVDLIRLRPEDPTKLLSLIPVSEGRRLLRSSVSEPATQGSQFGPEKNPANIQILRLA